MTDASDAVQSAYLIDTDHYFGAVDMVSRKAVWGWLAARDPRPLTVELVGFAEPLRRNVDLFREDLPEIGSPPGICGFAFDLSWKETLGVASLSFRVVDDPQPILEQMVLPRYFAGLDRNATAAMRRGWIIDMVDPCRRPRILVQTDDGPSMVARASLWRQDIADFGVTDGFNGFEVPSTLLAEADTALLLEDGTPLKAFIA